MSAGNQDFYESAKDHLGEIEKLFTDDDSSEPGNNQCFWISLVQGLIYNSLFQTDQVKKNLIRFFKDAIQSKNSNSNRVTAKNLIESIKHFANTQNVMINNQPGELNVNTRTQDTEIIVPRIDYDYNCISELGKDLEMKYINKTISFKKELHSQIKDKISGRCDGLTDCHRSHIFPIVNLLNILCNEYNIYVNMRFFTDSPLYNPYTGSEVVRVTPLQTEIHPLCLQDSIQTLDVHNNENLYRYTNINFLNLFFGDPEVYNPGDTNPTNDDFLNWDGCKMTDLKDVDQTVAKFDITVFKTPQHYEYMATFLEGTTNYEERMLMEKYYAFTELFLDADCDTDGGGKFRAITEQHQEDLRRISPKGLGRELTRGAAYPPSGFKEKYLECIKNNDIFFHILKKAELTIEYLNSIKVPYNITIDIPTKMSQSEQQTSQSPQNLSDINSAQSILQEHLTELEKTKQVFESKRKQGSFSTHSPEEQGLLKVLVDKITKLQKDIKQLNESTPPPELKSNIYVDDEGTIDDIDYVKNDHLYFIQKHIEQLYADTMKEFNEGCEEYQKNSESSDPSDRITDREKYLERILDFMLDTTPGEPGEPAEPWLLDTFFDHLGRKYKEKDIPNKELKDFIMHQFRISNSPSPSKISQKYFNPDIPYFYEYLNDIFIIFKNVFQSALIKDTEEDTGGDPTSKTTNMIYDDAVKMFRPKAGEEVPPYFSLHPDDHENIDALLTESEKAYSDMIFTNNRNRMKKLSFKIYARNRRKDHRPQFVIFWRTIRDPQIIADLYKNIKEIKYDKQTKYKPNFDPVQSLYEKFIFKPQSPPPKKNDDYVLTRDDTLLPQFIELNREGDREALFAFISENMEVEDSDKPPEFLLAEEGGLYRLEPEPLSQEAEQILNTSHIIRLKRELAQFLETKSLLEKKGLDIRSIERDIEVLRAQIEGKPVQEPARELAPAPMPDKSPVSVGLLRAQVQAMKKQHDEKSALKGKSVEEQEPAAAVEPHDPVAKEFNQHLEGINSDPPSSGDWKKYKSEFNKLVDFIFSNVREYKNIITVENVNDVIDAIINRIKLFENERFQRKSIKNTLKRAFSRNLKKRMKARRYKFTEGGKKITLYDFLKSKLSGDVSSDKQIEEILKRIKPGRIMKYTHGGGNRVKSIRKRRNTNKRSRIRSKKKSRIKSKKKSRVKSPKFNRLNTKSKRFRTKSKRFRTKKKL